jgi:hypothetical protein
VNPHLPKNGTTIPPSGLVLPKLPKLPSLNFTSTVKALFTVALKVT